jgi:hypothetical protein
MPHGKDWLSKRRGDQLALARNWLNVLGTKATAWKIPPAAVAELASLSSAASDALEETLNSRGNTVSTARCKAAFKALVAKMRFIKTHFFLKPLLSDADFAALELKPKSATRFRIPSPTIQAEADVSNPGIHLLKLHFRPILSPMSSPPHSDYGYRVYYGVMPPGGASFEAATGAKHELVKVPVSGEELPFSKFTRRKKELFDFDPNDSGKRAYFCVCYENSKGEPGPWGPLFSAVIT